MPMFRMDRAPKKKVILILLFLIAILFVGFQMGAGGEEKKEKELPWTFPKDQASTGSYPVEFPSLTKFLLSLGLVLGAIFLCLFLYKKYMSRTGHALGADKTMKVMETVPLGGRKFLHVVRVQGHHLVVGTSPDRVSLLTEIYEAQEEAQAGIASGRAQKPASFTDLMEGGRK